jgi:undecaprenyl-diphosphatase
MSGSSLVRTVEGPGQRRLSGPSGPRLRAFGSPLPFEPIAWLLAVLAFAGLAAWVTTGGADGLDQAVLAWLKQAETGWLDWVAHGVSLLGSEAIGVIHVVLLFFLARKRRWGLAAVFFFATAGAGFLNGPIKAHFGRVRPEEVYGLLPASGGQLYSFPSGHSMVMAAFFFVLAYATCPLLTGWRRHGWIAVLLTIAVLVGLARTYLGAHWLTDVLAGYLLGYVWAQSIVCVAHLIARRRGRNRACACPEDCGRHRPAQPVPSGGR